MTTAQAGSFLTLTGLGWYVKALFGVITDRVPLFGYRRKSWLIACLVAVGVLWWWVALTPTATSTVLFVALLTINIGLAFSDVVCDGLMVASAQRLERQFDLPPGTANRPLQASQWQGAWLAGILCAVGGGCIAQFFHLPLAAAIAGSLPLIVAIAIVWGVREERVATPVGAVRTGRGAATLLLIFGVGMFSLHPLLGSHWLRGPALLFVNIMILGTLACFIRLPRQLWIPSLVIFLWEAMPFNLNSQYFYQYVVHDRAAFSVALSRESSIGTWFSWVGSGYLASGSSAMAELFYGSVLLAVVPLCGIIAAVFFRRRWATSPLPTMWRWCLLAYAMELIWFFFPPLFGVANPLLLLMGSALAGFASALGMLSVSSYAASVVPEHAQASSFAFLMGAANLGRMMGVEWTGGYLYQAFGNVVAGKMMTPDHGLLAVLLAAFGHLGVLYGIISLLDRRGHFYCDR